MDSRLAACIERRAVEAVIWGMPAVNFQRMLDAFLEVGGHPNEVLYWSRPVNWKAQSLTPNPDTIYFTLFYDTRKGPVVLDIPSAAGGGSLTGSIDDAWQNPLEDVGPAGADQGKGGRYLILPPDYQDTVPEGYIVLSSETFQGFALLRSNVKSNSDDDIATAIAYGKRIGAYPLTASNGNAPETRFVDAYDTLYDSTIPYDARFFDALDRFIQVEPWLARDKAMIDIVASLGIARAGMPTRSTVVSALMDSAAAQAKALIAYWLDELLARPFNEGTQWALPASPQTIEGISNHFEDAEHYPIDERSVIYSIAYFSAKHLGQGQFYLMSNKDADGNGMQGGKTYRLRVPPDPPVDLYWSVTAYDGDTHALIRETSWSSRSSNTPGLQRNADGAVDVFFGPVAPGGKTGNWIPTDPDRRFELLFRLYGPRKAFFEKTWRLPDVERVLHG